MGEDLTNLTRALLVHATIGTKEGDPVATSPNPPPNRELARVESTKSSAIVTVTPNPPEGDPERGLETFLEVPDRPRVRAWIRWIGATIQILLFLATMANVVAVVLWRITVEVGANMAIVLQLR